jgi:hypothetical protein
MTVRNVRNELAVIEAGEYPEIPWIFDFMHSVSPYADYRPEFYSFLSINTVDGVQVSKAAVLPGDHTISVTYFLAIGPYSETFNTTFCFKALPGTTYCDLTCIKTTTVAYACV